MTNPLSRTRSVTVSTKVSEEENAQLEALAETRGLTMSEWCREVLLGELKAAPTEETMLAEIMALRMIVLNAFYKLVQGEKLSAGEMQELIDRADGERFRRSGERLKETAARKKAGGEKSSGNGGS
ncbi:MAG: plasmid mobilization protein [Bryobacteraceae bacterium]